VMNDSGDHSPGFAQARRQDAARSSAASQAVESVTRVVVLKPGGGYAEFWADSWEIIAQDTGRTMKLLPRGDGSEAITARTHALAASLGMSPEKAAEFTHAIAERDGQPDRFGPAPR
jgi:hypothetical protein